VCWLALNIARSEVEFERVVNLLLLTLAIQSVIYFAQSKLGLSFTLEGDVITLGALPRPGGTVSTNPAGFASFIVPILFIAIARFLDKRRHSSGVRLGILIMLGATPSVSHSRGRRGSDSRSVWYGS